MAYVLGPPTSCKERTGRCGTLCNLLRWSYFKIELPNSMWRQTLCDTRTLYYDPSSRMALT